MTEAILAVPNGHLAWSSGGTGAPVVLVHGFSFDRSMWDQQVATFESRFQVVRYDVRGFGASSRPDGPYDHVDDLEALLAVATAGAPLLVGLSLGANIVLEFVARHLGKARGMVLASSGLPGHAWTSERPPEAIRAYALEHGVEAARARWIDDPIYQSLRQRPPASLAFETMVSRYDGWHWTHDDPRRAPENLASRLPRIDTPALIISGDHDHIGYREIARRLAAELPRAQLLRFPGAGHLINMEEPDRFSAAVIDFEANLANEP
ncbi:MAG TPA: alpha/beta fold hydrolase [Sphingomonas sp.]|nr:alpha/beta fold hydrolase [Sphingomonas sp.]